MQNIALAADAVTVATGPGAFIKAASIFRKGLVIFELSLSAANVAANISHTDNEAFLSALQVSNALMAAIGVKNVLGGVSQADLMESVKFGMKNSAGRLGV